MAAPTVHHSTAASRAPRSEGGLHLSVMGPNVFESYPLPPSGSLRIGRDENADVRITDDLASRLHARLTLDAQAQLSVEDLGSSNGTFVRGERIEPGKRVPLQPGEAVTIGFTHLMVQRRSPPAPRRRFHSHGVFEERLEDACARAAETGAGHAIVRVQLSEDSTPGAGVDAVAGALRAGDLMAQYAPGDYEVLLFDTNTARAEALAADVLRRVRAAGLDGRAVVATYPADGRSAEALIGRTSALLRGCSAEAAHEPVLKSEAMRKLYRLAERAAAGHTATGLINVLILGETGVGKEVLADWIHRCSPRARGPFVCINCAALTDTLLESELFGHEKGAFTGATQAKAGLLDAATGGTVFLDEVGEMPPPLQTKLLRALESRRITRVGGLSARPIDVRFVAATNRDLEADVVAKTFRADLYFRLNGISLDIPPLRERRDEILLLARRFLADASTAASRRPPRLSTEAAEILQGYCWPGNIRELRNVIDRALVLCEEGEIQAEHLPVEKMRLAPLRPRARADSSAPAAAGSDLNAAERTRILDALAEVGWNQTRAAKALGMARGTLIARLKRYGVKRPQTRGGG